MIKHNRPTIALCLMVQSVTCLILHFIITSKKKNWANVILLLSAIGAGCAAYMMWRQSVEDKITARRRQRAMDSFCDISASDETFDDYFNDDDFEIPDFSDIDVDEADIPLD